MPPDFPDDIQVFERGWLSSNNVLFLGQQRNTLVDSGYASHAPQTVELLRARLQGQDLQQLINTHLHSDHCGGNAALQTAWPHALTGIPPGLSAQVRDWHTYALSYEPTGQSCPPFRFDFLLSQDTSIDCGRRTLQVLSAPGHDPHAVMLYEPELELLISGDALWEDGFGVVFPQLDGDDGFEDVEHTLALIDTLSVKSVVPGHGRVFADVRGALERARSRLTYFRRNPIAHARYASKVLVKFRLLEQQRMRTSELQTWMHATPYLQSLHRMFFHTSPWPAWTSSLLEDMVRTGALSMDADWVDNR